MTAVGTHQPGEPGPEDEALYATIDGEARDEVERRDSKIIYEALKRRRDEVGGGAEIPAEDKQLSERILRQARTRSAQISASRATAGSGRQATGAPIPWWLIVAWIVAIAGVATLWMWMK